MNIEGIENISIGKALLELDERLFKLGVKPFDIKVYGGFALLLNKIRPNPNAYTDIDLFGGDSDFSVEVNQVIKDVAIDFGLPIGWINHALGQTEDFKDVEMLFGKLKFKKPIYLHVITIYYLDIMSLLKMKIFAVETEWMAERYDLRRPKDIEDIKEIIKARHLTFEDLKQVSEDIVIDENFYTYLKTLL
jgi:hypothetical protein